MLFVRPARLATAGDQNKRASELSLRSLPRRLGTRGPQDRALGPGCGRRRRAEGPALAKQLPAVPSPMEPEPEPAARPLTPSAAPAGAVPLPGPKVKAGRLKGHTDAVLCLAVDPHRPCCLASGSEDGTVRLWDTRQGASSSSHRAISCFLAADEDAAVTSVSYSPDAPKGAHELYVAAGEQIFCFDLRKLSEPAAVSAAAADRGGDGAAAAAAKTSQEERLLRLGHVSDGSEGIVAQMQVNAEEINSLTVNAKGMFLAAADDSGSVSVVDLKPLRQGRGPPALFKTLAGGKGGHENICSAVRFVGWRPWELLSGGLDSRILAWDFSKGRATSSLDMTVGQDASGNQVLNPPFVHDMQLVTTAPREHAVVAGLGDGRLYWYYPNAPTAAAGGGKKGKGRAGAGAGAGAVVAYWVDQAHSSAVSCVASDDAGDGGKSGGVAGLVASGGNDGLVKIWQLPGSGADLLLPPPPPPPVEPEEGEEAPPPEPAA